MKFFRVVNFERFQHYKDRRPPWIKLHRGVLGDYEFSRLEDSTKAHLMLIWSLASQCDNRIPNDAEWIKGQVGSHQKPDLATLFSAGFIEEINDVATCEQSASDLSPKMEQNARPSVSVSDISKSILNPMDGFEIFWTEYPRKESKKKAAQVWKAHELAKLAAQIIADVKTRKAKHRPWREGYVPHASTYLNGERWNDAVDERGSAQAGPTRRTPAEAAAEKLAAELRAAKASAKRYGLKPQMEGEPDDNFIARVNRDMSDKMAGGTA